MRKPLYLVATALLAVTFCADRAMSATPALRPEVVQLAEKLVNKLSKSFSRTAACITIFPQRSSIAATNELPSMPVLESPSLIPQPTSPFQFRLPPPTV